MPSSLLLAERPGPQPHACCSIIHATGCMWQPQLSLCCPCSLLRRIYGRGKPPQKHRPDSAARSRLYDHLRLGKHLVR